MWLGRDDVHVWSVQLASTDRRSRREESHHALRQVLSAYLDRDPQRIAISTEAHGKPCLAHPDRPLRFNLSHSGDLALIAVTRECEVGVDVERKADRRDFARLARRGLGAAQAEAVCAAPPGERAERFYAAWVRREAIAKCLGTGLGAKLPARPLSVQNLSIDDGYAAAVALDR